MAVVRGDPAICLPQLDLAALRQDMAAGTAAEPLRAIRAICHEVGFLTVVNHGLETLRDAVFEAGEAFFALPLETKEAVHLNASPNFRGYTRVGEEVTGGVSDYKEVLDLALETAALEPEARARAVAAGEHFRLLSGSNAFPVADGGRLARLLNEYLVQARMLGIELLEILAMALELPRDAFARHCSPYQGPEHETAAYAMMRLIRYPPQDPTIAQGERRQGVGKHCDYGLLTLLSTDDVGGLEVQMPNGAWLAVPPDTRSLVLNFGDMLELWTGLYVLATPHRVCNPSSTRARLSVPVFVEPDLTTVVVPMALPDYGEPALVRSDAQEAERRTKFNGATRIVYGEHMWAAWVRSYPAAPLAVEYRGSHAPQPSC